MRNCCTFVADLLQSGLVPLRRAGGCCRHAKRKDHEGAQALLGALDRARRQGPRSPASCGCSRSSSTTAQRCTATRTPRRGSTSTSRTDGRAFAYRPGDRYEEILGARGGRAGVRRVGGGVPAAEASRGGAGAARAPSPGEFTGNALRTPRNCGNACDMPNIGPMELAIVAVIALLVLGPKRLPAAGRSLGRGIREFKDGIGGRATRGARRGCPSARPSLASQRRRRTRWRPMVSVRQPGGRSRRPCGPAPRARGRRAGRARRGGRRTLRRASGSTSGSSRPRRT